MNSQDKKTNELEMEQMEKVAGGETFEEIDAMYACKTDGHNFEILSSYRDGLKDYQVIVKRCTRCGELMYVKAPAVGMGETPISHDEYLEYAVQCGFIKKPRTRKK